MSTIVRRQNSVANYNLALTTPDTRKSFRIAILPITVISCLLGIFPISFYITEKDSARVSVIGVLYGLCISALESGFTINRLYFAYSEGVQKYILKFAGVVYPFMVVSGFWIFLFRAKSLSTVINNIFSYSNLVRFNRYYSSIFWFLTFQVVILVLFAGGYYIRLYMLLPSIYWTPMRILDNFTEFAIMFSIPLINFQQMNLLFLLYRVFNFLNDELERIEPEKIFTPRRNKNELIRQNLVKGYRTFSLFDEQPDIGFLTSLYQKLCKTCETLNEVYGAPASASSAHTLIVVVLTSFAFLVNHADAMGSILRLLLTCIELWVLTFSCELVTQEVRRNFWKFICVFEVWHRVLLHIV